MFRIFGKIINKEIKTVVRKDGVERIVPVQYEIAYRDYDDAGNLLAEGTEVFKPLSFWNRLNCFNVWVWNGKRTRSGRRKFKYMECISYRPSDKKAVYDYIRNKYSSALKVEFR